jgi:hypothetical protein
MVQEGCIGPKEAHSLICSLGEFERRNGDGNGSIVLGKLGHLHPWRAHAGLDPHYFLVLVIAWRRVHSRRRAHTYLVVGGLVLLQICPIHGGGGTQLVVCVK